MSWSSPSPLYVPLWCKSNFSFLEGASHPEELVETASQLGLPALALTDRDGVYGVVRAHMRARDLGIKLLLGAEVTLSDATTLVLLVQNRIGYGHLCRLISRGRLRSPKGACTVHWSEVCAHAEGLLALQGGERGLCAREEPAGALQNQSHDKPLAALHEAFGDRLYAMLTRHYRAREVAAEARLRASAERYQLPLVAVHEVLYHTPERHRLQDVLTCLRHRVALCDAGGLLKPNQHHALKNSVAFASLFADSPEAVARTHEVASRCTFSLAELRYRYPDEDLPGGLSVMAHLRALTLAGARTRYGHAPPEPVVRQIDKELTLITELDYGGYFLTMHEIVQFCRVHGILCQGRGSAASSVVCYCLGITAIDPVHLGLLFERFLSRERAEPPDIDLDIAHERREEVIQHVYAKYGRERAAMVANFIRYRPRSALRDVGFALGLSASSLDRLAKLSDHYEAIDASTLTRAGLDAHLPAHTRLIELAQEIQNFPRHLSIHPGGFLLGHEPLCSLVPIENASMEGRTVIQWDKTDVEALGLFKVDLLGLGALSQLDRAFRLLAEHRGIALSLATIPANDTATFDAICQGDVVGVFQIESRAQMSMLPRLRPRTYYDLVVEVSIVRPGPITGGMVHPYLRRRNGEEPVDYPHPALRPVLEKTLGVPLFQEQVMRLAMVAADYTPGEADQLRRDMAAWRRSGRIDAHRERLVTRMLRKGIAKEFAERVFEQIRGFGEYGFPESHAASFALISYAAAYVHHHYPAEFACALLNAQPMGFYSPASIVDDAKRHGIVVLPIDVTRSDWDCTLEAAPAHPAVRMGLRYVKGLSAQMARDVLATRHVQPFVSLEDFARRGAVAEPILQQLALAGALAAFGLDRRTTLWEARRLARTRQLPLPLTTREPLPSFAALDLLTTIGWDYATSSHSSRGHPLGALRDALRQQGLPDAQTVRTLTDGEGVSYVGLVICRQRPATAAGVVFMTLEDETGLVNLVLWRAVFERYEVLAKTAAFLGVRGRVQSRHDVVHVVADSLWLPQLGPARVAAASRDFH